MIATNQRCIGWLQLFLELLFSARHGLGCDGSIWNDGCRRCDDRNLAPGVSGALLTTVASLLVSIPLFLPTFGFLECLEEQ